MNYFKFTYYSGPNRSVKKLHTEAFASNAEAQQFARGMLLGGARVINVKDAGPVTVQTAVEAHFKRQGAPAVRPDYDVRMHDNGSIVLFELQTEAAKTWVNENVADPNYFGTRLAVEARYVSDLFSGMRVAGLVVR